MITAIVMVHAQVDRIPEVAQSLADLVGVSEVYSVTGDADLIAVIRVRRHEELADVIAGRLNKVTGVLSTQTHIAFQAYSRHDLEATFSLGDAPPTAAAPDVTTPDAPTPDVTAPDAPAPEVPQ